MKLTNISSLLILKLFILSLNGSIYANSSHNDAFKQDVSQLQTNQLKNTENETVKSSELDSNDSLLDFDKYLDDWKIVQSSEEISDQVYSTDIQTNDETNIDNEPIDKFTVCESDSNAVSSDSKTKIEKQWNLPKFCESVKRYFDLALRYIKFIGNYDNLRTNLESKGVKIDKVGSVFENAFVLLDHMLFEHKVSKKKENIDKSVILNENELEDVSHIYSLLEFAVVKLENYLEKLNAASKQESPTITINLIQASEIVTNKQNSDKTKHRIIRIIKKNINQILKRETKLYVQMIVISAIATYAQTNILPQSQLCALVCRRLAVSPSIYYLESFLKKRLNGIVKRAAFFFLSRSKIESIDKINQIEITSLAQAKVLTDTEIKPTHLFVPNCKIASTDLKFTNDNISTTDLMQVGADM